MPPGAVVPMRAPMVDGRGRASGAAPSPDLAGASSFDRQYASRTLVLLATLAALIVYIDVMLLPALPTIAAEYHVSIAQTSLLISLYTVFGVAVMPIIGKLGDIYGKRRVLLYTLGIYLAVATTTSFAPTFELVLISRFFQGVGLGVFPLAFSIAREEFPRPLVPRAQGLLSAVQVAGGAAGILGGAIVTSDFGWQANYHLALPGILGLSLLTFFLVRESPNLKPGVHLDYVGATCLGASLTAVVLGLSEGASWGWTSLAIVGLIGGGFLGLIPLSVYESRQREPVFNLRLLRQRNILLANLITLVYGAAGYLAFQAITYYVQLPPPSGFGLSLFQTGLTLIPLVVVLLPVALVVGTVIPRYGVKPFLLFGALFGIAGFLLLSVSSSPAEVGGFLTVYAVGAGLISVSRQNLLVLSLNKTEMGLGTSLNTSFFYIGQSLGAPLAGAILTTFVFTQSASGHSVTLPTSAAFHYCFYAAAFVYILVGLLTVLAREVIGRHAGPASSSLPLPKRGE